MTNLTDLRDAIFLWFTAAVLTTVSGYVLSFSDVHLLVRLGLIFIAVVGYVTALACLILGGVNVALAWRKLRQR